MSKDPNIVNLSGVDDPEDPRIAEAADEVVDNLRALQDAMGLDTAAMLYDAIADRLEVLIEETEAELEAEADESEDTDDALLTEDDEE